MHMNSCQDHYAVLGVAPNADPDVIRAAYRVLAQRHHPDRNATGDSATMVRLNQAYAVLSCPELRNHYDRMQMQTQAPPHQEHPQTTPPRATATRESIMVTTYDHRGRLHAGA